MYYAILSGFLLFVCFLPFKFHWILPFFAFVPIIYGLYKKKIKIIRDFWLTGIVFNFLTLYWVPRTVEIYGKTGWLIAFVAYIMLAFYLSLFFALWGVMTRLSRYYAISLPLSFVITEWLKTKLIYGFPLFCLSHAVADFSYLIQIAEFLGQWGVSLCIVTVNVFIYKALFERQFKFLTGVLFVIAVMMLPELTLKVPDHFIKVAVVQPSLSEEEKWDPSKRIQNTMLVIDMIKEACLKSDLVVAPETTFPFYFEKDEKMTQFLIKQLSSCKVPIVFGGISYKRLNKKLYFLNGAYLFYKGRIVDRYYKVILVPFGEFMPLRETLSFIYSLFPAPSDFAAGYPKLLDAPSLERFSCLICYEAAFSYYQAYLTKLGAAFIVNITNDMWFGKTIAPYAHFWSSILRTVENRKWMIRAANTGISAIVCPYGKIFAKKGLFEKGIMYSKIAFDYRIPFYVRHRLLIMKILFALWFLTIIFSFIRLRWR